MSTTFNKFLATPHPVPAPQHCWLSYFDILVPRRMGILVYYGPVAGPLQAAAQVQAVLGQQALPASHHSSQVKSEYQSCLFSDLLWCGNWSRTEKKKV